MHKLKILFITRKFPPSIGGMQKFAYQLYNELSKNADVTLLKWSGEPPFLLPFIMIFYLLKSFWILLRKKIDVIYLDDAVLTPLGLFLRLYGKPIAVTINGLDITRDNKLYQIMVSTGIRTMDAIICISHSSFNECTKRYNRLTPFRYIIPPGFKDVWYISSQRNILKQQLSEKLNVKLGNKKIILTVGRLVKRKGFHWYVNWIVPKLKKNRRDLIYIIVGDGDLRTELQMLISEKNLNDCVILTSAVNDETLKLFYNCADIFIMPNIPVEGDMEGFGIVALEASSCGVPVIASNLEGIPDAVKEGQNGYLIEPLNEEKWIEMTMNLLNRDLDSIREKIRKFTIENYSMDKICDKYIEIFKKCIKG